MEKISFNTAKLANEAGYTLKAFDCGYSKRDNKIYNNIFGYHDEYYPAFYQEELQAWLRTKHNIHVFVRTDYSSSERFYHFYTVITIVDGYADYKYGEPVDSYEDALDAGLIKGLNMLIDAK